MDTIQPCTDPSHGDGPHHHTVSHAEDAHLPFACPGCNYGAPTHQHTPDLVEQIQTLIDVAINSKVFDSARGLPTTWRDEVAVVRTPSTEVLWNTKEVPDGFVLFLIDGDGDQTTYESGDVYVNLTHGVSAVYLLPTSR